MKRKYFAMALMGALAGFSSCSEEEELSSLAPTQNGVQINAEIVGYEDPTHARTVIDNEGKVAWEEDEYLSIGYIYKGEQKPDWDEAISWNEYQYHSGKFEATESQVSLEPNVENYLIATNRSIKYFYSKDAQGDIKSIYSNTLKQMNRIQDGQLPDKGIGRDDVLAGFTTITPTGKDDVIHFKMKHLLSLLKFNIQNNTDQKFIIKEFRLETPEGTIVDGEIQPTYGADNQGNFVLDENLTYKAEGLAHSNIANKQVKNEPEMSPGSSYTVQMLVIPFKLAANQTIKIWLETSAGQFSQTYTMGKNLEFKAGALSTATVKVNKLEAYDDNNVYIEDRVFRTHLLKLCGKDQNQKLTKEELGTIESLDMAYLDIQSLKGIENLTNLTSLYIDRSDIVELDLTQNTQLTSLFLEDVHLLKDLKIQGLSALKKLRLEESGDKIKDVFDLDLTGCNNLESLHLEGTKINHLNVPQKDKLTVLTLFAIKNLTALDLHEYSALNAININGNQNLTSVNVSGLNALKTLNLYNNKSLSQINLSGCTALTFLNNSECTKLQQLDLSAATKLQALNVSLCTQLQQLDLSALTQLQTLTANECDLRNLNLTQNKELTEVTLYDNPNMGTLDVSGLAELSYLDANNCGLTSLNLTGCNMLGNLFAKNNKLTELDLSDCSHYMGQGYAYIVNIENNPGLKTVYVWEEFAQEDHPHLHADTDVKFEPKKKETTPVTPAQ